VLCAFPACPRIVACMDRFLHSLRLAGRFVCSLVVVCFVGSLALIAAPAASSAAQQPAQRVVQGKVVGSADTGLKGATVYLKDGHTLAVKSYIAGDDGSYRFGQLTQTADYQLWAEWNGKKSAVKNITSFDTRTEFNITLKIDTK
jgi:hypothetical protein